MTNLTITQMGQFEAALTVGQTVTARWTNNHQYHSALAEVVKINKASVRVKLLQDTFMTGWSKVAPGEPLTKSRIVHDLPYLPAGREISLPRMPFFALNSKWSWNNGVFPLPESK